MSIFSKALYLSMLKVASKIEKKFDYYTKNAYKTNTELLFSILKNNSETEFGKKYKFNEIKSIEDYKNNVPLSTYDNYQKYIGKIAKGEKNILTKEDVAYFGRTSGTTGTQKLIPITKSGKRIPSKYNALLSQKFAYNELKDNWNYGKGVMLTDVIVASYTDGGIPISAASSGGMKSIKSIIPFIWTSPIEVMELENKDSAFYLHALFALREKNLMYISGIFISSILDFFRLIEEKHDLLINDIRAGKINEKVELNPEIRKRLNKKLSQFSKRADELEFEFNKGFKGIAKRIWPSVAYIASVTGANFTIYDNMVDFYTDKLPVYSSTYGASEGMIGINPYINKIEYVVVPDSCYFEFIRIEDVYKQNPVTNNINELILGNEYEIVITNLNGLYRYRLGDVVKVVGFYNESPKLEFLYRKNQLLNMVSEKTTEQHIKISIEATITEFNLNLVDYTTFADNDNTPGRYIIYLEFKNFNNKYNISQIEEKLDDELKKVNLAYGRFRNNNRLAKLKIVMISEGTFDNFKKSLINKGASKSQLKVPRVIKDNNILCLSSDS
ncbi:GH3 auxin-responsive promoter family protein [Clostridium uliginosum]|uniref:GH3 auxin-responsive promoter n=1 Tax=Clostridium uliginosum TaxID=119641 RepID=A0A1I1S6R7_9CLOT|nr:GH3 auxin-responsive promoter family protein [Clostridium uliginosum]SFD42067.1 GH3 auxin-responsive promoter [Clostridium uliginosum]